MQPTRRPTSQPTSQPSGQPSFRPSAALQYELNAGFQQVLIGPSSAEFIQCRNASLAFRKTIRDSLRNVILDQIQITNISNAVVDTIDRQVSANVIDAESRSHDISRFPPLKRFASLPFGYARGIIVTYNITFNAQYVTLTKLPIPAFSVIENMVKSSITSGQFQETLVQNAIVVGASLLFNTSKTQVSDIEFKLVESFQLAVTHSAYPSSVPTSQPSAVPSCPPTREPTNTPSSQPSSKPSLQPSSSPTSQPTYERQTQWIHYVNSLFLNDGFAARYNLFTSYQRFSYVQLMAQKEMIYGGCDTWNQLGAKDIANILQSFETLSISFLTQTDDLFTAPTNRSLISLTCEDYIKNKDILSALHNRQNASIECDNHVWKIGVCGGLNAEIQLCIDCDTPCASMACSSSFIPRSDHIHSLFYLAPCSSDLVSCMSGLATMQILNIQVRERPSYGYTAVIYGNILWWGILVLLSVFAYHHNQHRRLQMKKDASARKSNLLEEGWKRQIPRKTITGDQYRGDLPMYISMKNLHTHLMNHIFRHLHMYVESEDVISTQEINNATEAKSSRYHQISIVFLKMKKQLRLWVENGYFWLRWLAFHHPFGEIFTARVEKIRFLQLIRVFGKISLIMVICAWLMTKEYPMNDGTCLQYNDEKSCTARTTGLPWLSDTSSSSDRESQSSYFVSYCIWISPASSQLAQQSLINLFDQDIYFNSSDRSITAIDSAENIIFSSPCQWRYHSMTAVQAAYTVCWILLFVMIYELVLGIGVFEGILLIVNNPLSALRSEVVLAGEPNSEKLGNEDSFKTLPRKRVLPVDNSRSIRPSPPVMTKDEDNFSSNHMVSPSPSSAPVQLGRNFPLSIDIPSNNDTSFGSPYHRLQPPSRNSLNFKASSKVRPHEVTTPIFESPPQLFLLQWCATKVPAIESFRQFVLDFQIYYQHFLHNQQQNYLQSTSQVNTEYTNFARYWAWYCPNFLENSQLLTLDHIYPQVEIEENSKSASRGKRLKAPITELISDDTSAPVRLIMSVIGEELSAVRTQSNTTVMNLKQVSRILLHSLRRQQNKMIVSPRSTNGKFRIVDTIHSSNQKLSISMSIWVTFLQDLLGRNTAEAWLLQKISDSFNAAHYVRTQEVDTRMEEDKFDNYIGFDGHYEGWGLPWICFPLPMFAEIMVIIALIAVSVIMVYYACLLLHVFPLARQIEWIVLVVIVVLAEELLIVSMEVVERCWWMPMLLLPACHLLYDFLLSQILKVESIDFADSHFLNELGATKASHESGAEEKENRFYSPGHRSNVSEDERAFDSISDSDDEDISEDENDRYQHKKVHTVLATPSPTSRNSLRSTSISSPRPSRFSFIQHAFVSSHIADQLQELTDEFATKGKSDPSLNWLMQDTTLSQLVQLIQSYQLESLPAPAPLAATSWPTSLLASASMSPWSIQIAAATTSTFPKDPCYSHPATLPFFERMYLRWLTLSQPWLRCIFRYGISILLIYSFLHIHLLLAHSKSSNDNSYYAAGVVLLVFVMVSALWILGGTIQYYYVTSTSGESKKDRLRRSWWQAPIRLDKRGLQTANALLARSQKGYSASSHSEGSNIMPVISRTLFTFAHDERLMMLQTAATRLQRPLDEIMQMELDSQERASLVLPSQQPIPFSPFALSESEDDNVPIHAAVKQHTSILLPSPPKRHASR